MQQLRKDNHYVPKLYLKQWAHEGQISTYRLLVPSENVPLWKKQSLKGIAYHQHLYTYLAGQEETDEFERWLDSEFESPAEEAIRRVVREDRMSPELSRPGFSRHLASSTVRHYSRYVLR